MQGGEVVKGVGMGGAVRPRGAGLPTGEQDGLHVTSCFAFVVGL